MNWFYKVRLVVVVFCIVSVNLIAQNDSNFLKYAIKTNVFQWGMNEPNIGFEYRFSPRFGWENTIGTYGILNRSFHTGPDVMEPLPQEGITLRSNFKWYYATGNKYQRDGGYISPMLLLKRNTVDGYFSTISSYEDKEEKRFITGLSLLFGYQTVRRHFIWDFYLGGGIRYRYINATVRKAESSEGLMYPPGFLPFTYIYDEWQPSIHIGVKMGYNVRGTPFEPRRVFKSPYFKHVISTNIFSAILREQNIAYEYRFNRYIGLEAIAGAYLIKQSRSYAFDESLKIQHSHSLYIQPKIYLGSLSNAKEGTFYISPMFMYRNEDFKSESQYVTKLSDEKNGLSLLTGYLYLNRHAVFNVYFGAGYHKHHLIYRTEVVSGLHENDFTSWRLSFHGGLKVGYGFKQIN